MGIDLDKEIEAEDAEVAFRRGYQQGAYDAIRALNEKTPIATVRNWIDVKLAAWRCTDRVHDRGVRPPRP
jgi:hypothetical protein